MPNIGPSHPKPAPVGISGIHVLAKISCMPVLKSCLPLLLLLTAQACGPGPEGDSGRPPSPLTGTLDLVSSADIAGWAWDKTHTHSVVKVEIFDGDQLITTVLADRYREDLEKAGIGDGKHAFRLEVPESLNDGKPHRIRAKIANSTTDLTSSPKTLLTTSSVK
jgi:hypothetical protein